MDNIKKRVLWIDLLKAISMLFVMLGHIDFCPSQWSYFYGPFFLSAFLFASGYTFNNKRSFSEFFINKVKTLLVPMFIFSLINIGSRLLLTFNNDQVISQDIKDCFFQIRGKNDELWFIACIFGASIVFYFVNKLINKQKIFIITILLLCFCSIIYDKTIGIPLPWHIQMYGSACFYMGLGALYKQNENKLRKFINYYSLMLTLIMYFIIVSMQYVYKQGDPIVFYNYGQSILRYFTISGLGLAMILQIVNLIPNIKLLSFIGRNSFIYYAFHGKVESLILVVLKKSEVLSQQVINGKMILLLIIYLILEVILLIPVAIIINRYFPFMLGRSKVRNY
ncbi:MULTISPECIES: acyltransferase family protein [Clostridia]|uniref:Acyltransferase n=2 Tax=Clostridia TaxID=186801 RepID=A0A8I0A6D6_9CLOT|nr:acyltransferase [uncultured Clostridium sp.]MBC5639002.1 acyltransferase [Clostridium lentum]MBC5653095.1 acyltransferase [Blautia lenta]